MRPPIPRWRRPARDRERCRRSAAPATRVCARAPRIRERSVAGPLGPSFRALVDVSAVAARGRAARLSGAPQRSELATARAGGVRIVAAVLARARRRPIGYPTDRGRARPARVRTRPQHRSTVRRRPHPRDLGPRVRRARRPREARTRARARRGPRRALRVRSRGIRSVVFERRLPPSEARLPGAGRAGSGAGRPRGDPLFPVGYNPGVRGRSRPGKPQRKATA